MLRNYIKIAFRNLWRHRVFSSLNILGLTVGLTAFFLIFLYVEFELSYDSFHKKADNIYRIVVDLKTPTETIPTSGPAWAVAPNIKNEFPEVEAAVRFGGTDMLVRKGDIKFNESKAAFADSAFFRVFDFPLLKGDPATALRDELSIVMSEHTAKKYFGNSDPIGQQVLITGEGQNAKITGIMKDMPENSHIKADMLLSMRTLTQKFNRGLDSQWSNYGSETFLLLKTGTDYKKFEQKIPAFLEKRNGTEMKQLQMFPTLKLEPMLDVYLRSTRNSSNGTGNITNVYIFSIIGLFILIIACINFINLTTARSSERAKEVGIRKVVGAGKGQLARQFIGESVIICLIAFVFTILLSMGVLGLFNQLSGKTISEGIFEHPSNILLLLAISVGIGLMAGIYPALVLSSFQPIKVLKGRFTTASGGVLLRKGLVITQFAISIALIIGTIVVFLQMRFMRNSDLGFDKKQEIIIDSQGDPSKLALVQGIRSLPGASSVAMSGSVPGGGNPGAYSQVENSHGDMQIANLDLYFVDFDYIPQYKIKMIAGRPFSKEMSTDTTKAMILNEAAVKLFGYTSPAQAIGKKYDQWGSKGTIVGVMKDFHFRSLQEVIKPLSMRIDINNSGIISVNAGSKDIPTLLNSIEAKWNQLIPNKPFSYTFLDETYDLQYRAEERFGRLFLNFAILAIFISCMGLLGLASYNTMQRTREIGIRKVMGASVSGIVRLLSKDFMILVLIAFVIAVPVSWYFMNGWLKDFAYRIDITWWIFLLAGILAMLIAMITISFQAIKAALTNPIRSMRTE